MNINQRSSNVCFYSIKILYFYLYSVQHSQTSRYRPALSAATSTGSVVSSGGRSDTSSVSQSIDYREIYKRILPYVR
jgi:hypothetical protein